MEELNNGDSYLDPKWLEMFYEQVGREASLARESQRETHNWVITLAAGIFTAIFALGGNQIKYPSEIGFIGLLIITPLFFRFFVRSCLEYQIFHRWIVIRNGLDSYYFSKNNSQGLEQQISKYLLEIISLYYFQWKAPKHFLKMIWDNFRLAYGWLFIILIALIIWGIIEQPMTLNIKYTLILFIPWMSFELISFIRYRGFNYYKPSLQIDISSLGEIVTNNL